MVEKEMAKVGAASGEIRAKKSMKKLQNKLRNLEQHSDRNF